jgi:hypothetical protein
VFWLGYTGSVQVRDVEVWQLLDERLDEVRRLPYDELCRRTRCEAELELLERPAGAFRRRTRVIALPHDRLGISVRVDAEGHRRRAEAGIVITPTGDIAPEWSRSGEPPRGNPFAFGLRTTLVGLALCALLLLVFFLST